MRCLLGLGAVLIVGAACAEKHAEKPAEKPVVFADRPSDDHRLGELKTLNGFFPFQAVTNLAAWKQRQIAIKRRVLVSQGLWPLPTRAPLNAVVHGRVERDGYVVDRVFFESIPGPLCDGKSVPAKRRARAVPCDPFSARALARGAFLRCRSGNH